MRLEVKQQRDECGDLEEFSWDLFPIVESTQTRHLDENGLPKPGTKINPGMIIIGKIGKTRLFDPKRKPSAFEIHEMSFSELSAKYGPMWRDTSLYASPGTYGTVKRAFFEDRDGITVAVVDLEG
jgi:DNA-directed RNA polymerase beta subunit